MYALSLLPIVTCATTGVHPRAHLPLDSFPSREYSRPSSCAARAEIADGSLDPFPKTCAHAPSTEQRATDNMRHSAPLFTPRSARACVRALRFQAIRSRMTRCLRCAPVISPRDSPHTTPSCSAPSPVRTHMACNHDPWDTRTQQPSAHWGHRNVRRRASAAPTAASPLSCAASASVKAPAVLRNSFAPACSYAHALPAMPRRCTRLSAKAVGACTKGRRLPSDRRVWRWCSFGSAAGRSIGSKCGLAAVPRMYETFNQTYGQHVAEVRPNREGGVR